MTVWDERAAQYVASDAHREGADLDQLVAWASGCRTALDVASGGGHVGRRLREAGLEVVTCDPSPGMRADVLCRAEDLPFADASFDLVACRVAAHHFADVAAAVAEMGRVAACLVLVVDTTFMGEAVEEAERLRDPSHVRNYDERQWRAFFARAALRVEEVRFFQQSFDVAAWLRRTGCAGAEAERVLELLGGRVADGHLTLDRIALRAAKS